MTRKQSRQEQVETKKVQKNNSVDITILQSPIRPSQRLAFATLSISSFFLIA